MINFEGWELLNDTPASSYYRKEKQTYLPHRRLVVNLLGLFYDKDLNTCQITASIPDHFAVCIYEGKLEDQKDLETIQTLLSI
jgi:hypothetical protein